MPNSTQGASQSRLAQLQDKIEILERGNKWKGFWWKLIHLILVYAAGVTLICYSGFKFIQLAELALKNNLNSAQAAVQISIVISWGAILIAALLYLPRKDDPWR